MQQAKLKEILRGHPKRFILFFLLILTISAFGRATTCGFINFDDPSYVTENTHVVSGLSPANIRWAFTSVEMSNWHPLTWFSHMADVELYGMNPAGHHLTSILLHTANVLLLFLFLNRITGAVWRSACVAALFAVHPLHVESVVWVSERKDVLSTLLFLCALLAYCRYAERPGPSRYVITLCAFALGLMAKPMIVTFPFLLILLDYWPLGRYPAKLSFPRLLIEKIPFFLLSACSAVLTFYAQQKGGAVASMEVLPFGMRFANALLAYVSYVGKTFWPSRLAAVYPFPDRIPTWEVAGAALLLTAITAGVLMASRRMPFLPVGWFWFTGTLVPVIGLVQVGGQAMADRYSYIPHIGLFVMIVWGASECAGQWVHSAAFPAAAMTAVVAALAAVTSVQISYWRNGVELFSHALAVTGRNPLAQYHLGVALTERGRLDEAIYHYARAVEIEPSYALAHFGLGCNLMQRGDVEQAVAEYEKAARLDPRDAKVLYNLGVALFKLGRINDAITRYREALRITPQDDNIHNNLGSALLRVGRSDEALAEFTEALRINPRNEWARINMQSFRQPEENRH